MKIWAEGALSRLVYAYSEPSTSIFLSTWQIFVFSTFHWVHMPNSAYLVSFKLYFIVFKYILIVFKIHYRLKNNLTNGKYYISHFIAIFALDVLLVVLITSTVICVLVLITSTVIWAFNFQLIKLHFTHIITIFIWP